MPVTDQSLASKTTGTHKNLKKAVHRFSPFSADGLSERVFTILFSGLVYPQIWEDPEVDMQALELTDSDRLICIGSGGCNAFSYLTANPAEVIVVDLNRHHVHLIRLKQAGLKHLPSYQTFFQFFGAADHPENPGVFDRHLKRRLVGETRAYWQGWDIPFRRRISRFSRNFYRYGLLGRFIGLGHLAAKLFGVRLAELLEAGDLDAQRAWYDKVIPPLFERRVVKWLTTQKASLFGLGIPPAQYDSLAEAGGGDMAVVLKRRIEKLACDFPVSENYFAQQAFGRRYATGDAGPLPPYLQSRHFEVLKERADRLSVSQRSVTERLNDEADQSLDAYVFLDAQDWMTDAQLNDLWSEVTRTARPGARVIFRTADEPSLLPGRVAPEILAQWDYRQERSEHLNTQDRSAIYGGFHLYVRRP